MPVTLSIARRSRPRSPVKLAEHVLRLDLEAIALDVDDANAVANGGWAAARRPDAVGHAHSPAVLVDGLHHHHHLPEEPGGAVVDERVAL